MFANPTHGMLAKTSRIAAVNNDCRIGGQRIDTIPSRNVTISKIIGTIWIDMMLFSSLAMLFSIGKN